MKSNTLTTTIDSCGRRELLSPRTRLCDDSAVNDSDVKRAASGITEQPITPVMIENYLRRMMKRLEEHTETFKDASHAAAKANAEHTIAHAKALYRAPNVGGKPATGPMREAYAIMETETELTNKLVCEATVKALQEAGRNLREAAECGRSVSASVRGNL